MKTYIGGNEEAPYIGSDLPNRLSGLTTSFFSRDERLEGIVNNFKLYLRMLDGLLPT
jgi:hypothetical protein